MVAKVRFFIHQTYAPNNVIDVAHPPYHLIRRGWGEFPARVQIHFKGPSGVNKPVDVMHFIKVICFIVNLGCGCLVLVCEKSSNKNKTIISA